MIGFADDIYENLGLKQSRVLFMLFAVTMQWNMQLSTTKTLLKRKWLSLKLPILKRISGILKTKKAITLNVIGVFVRLTEPTCIGAKNV